MRATLGPIAVLALLPVVAGCVATGGDEASPAAVCGSRIAVLGPLSGDSADLGGYIYDGARLAFDQDRAEHPDCPVDLVDFDSQGDPKQAPVLAQRIVDDPRIVGVIGPGFSGEAEAALPILDQGGVTTITTSATRTELSERGWSTFHRLIGNDTAQGRAAGWYIDQVLDGAAVFVIDDGGAYGRGLADEVVDRLGAKVVQRATIAPRTTDFAAVVGQVRSAAADVVFYGGYYGEAGRLQRQLRSAGLTPTFVAGDAVKADGYFRTAGDYADADVVITCPCLPPERAGEEFPQRYRDAFGVEPGTNSAESYDAARVFLAGLRAGNSDRTSMEAFVDAYDAPGVATHIAWTKTGELVDSSVSVWAFRVERGLFVAERSIPAS
ncbi:branched-chain amino acid ABC transporter substrate-binding protein [Micromonospora sp. NBC_01813]|uniref:branched-chain amino acid ABC transporter substrate-binding protein n=1 Tax=Micromonospora sp. NBC_01813 TaxID=2975988 RepID=UPI002DDA1DF9|nr:branched-chain amino acid ABC transporter substrate-binding protein [Micromonospora sp. NBC_01813]WSA08081.1 branched-chain amino acid ABC transporter substrate-binding protein [Micromonospora sp. NBC_01813]